MKKETKTKKLTFDLKQLGIDCMAKRGKDGVTLRVIKDDYGVGISQMYNIEAGKNTPNADTLARVIDWLGQPVEKYFIKK